MRVHHAEEHEDAPGKGHAGTHGHQRIHIGRAVDEPLPAGDEELLVDDQHNGAEDHLQEGKGHMVSGQESRRRETGHVHAHGEIHEHEQEAEGGEQPAPEAGCFRIPEGIFRRGGRRRGSGSAFFTGTVPGFLHGTDDFRRGGGAFHTHGIGEQAD